VRIRATLHMMAESEILAMVKPETMARIKTTDKSPTLKAYVVGHEGEARGNLIGVGNIIKKWYGDMIKKLNEKINIGLQLFHGHAATNDTAGRVPIGEVVGNKLMNIKDRLSSVVACWIYPDYRHLPLDVASIEADVNLEGDAKSELYVADVNEITGIALGNSEIETPGFPGATLLGQLQAFVAEKEKFHITLFKKGDNMDITLADLKKAIQEDKLQPTDIFSHEVLFADPAIKEHVQEKIQNARGYDVRQYEKLVDKKAEIEQKLKDAETQIAAKDGEIGTFKLETAKTKVNSLFEAQKTERTLDEKQVKYVQTRLGDFTPQKPEDLEKELNAHLDNLLKDYRDLAKNVFGIESEGDPPKKVNGGTGPTVTKTGSPENKYVDPEQNPMIRTD